MFPTLSRLAVLVVGPEGSGKNVAVRAATQAVGCHLVSLNCHALKPADSSDAKVLEAIAAAFDAASKFGPTALFLTHMNALGTRGGLDVFTLCMICVERTPRT